MNCKNIAPEQFCGHTLSPRGTQVFNEIVGVIIIPITYRTEKRISSGQISYNRDGAIITISDDLPDVCYEETLLHELFHIVQFQSGFPDLIADDMDDQIQHCTAVVSSIVADMGVAEFLHSRKIKMHKELGDQQYMRLKKHAELLAGPKFAPRLNNVELLDYAALYSNLYLTYHKQKGQYLIDVLSRVDPTVRIFSKRLIDIIAAGDTDTPEGCMQIFSKLSQQFPFMGWHIKITLSQSTFPEISGHRMLAMTKRSIESL